MIKRILVPTDGSEGAAVGMNYAIGLASQYSADLVGLHVVDIRLLEGPFLRDLSASLGTAPFVNYENNIASLLEERGRLALQTFADMCEGAKLSCERVLATGAVTRTIVENSELTDLVVLGRTGEHSQWAEGLLGSTTQDVVRRAHSPVLVTGREKARLDSLVLAYDGSSHARKAIQLSADIGEAWGVPVTVLVVGDEGVEETLAEARAYLDSHNVEAKYEGRTGDPSEIITGYVETENADLLVMGAYGHTKVRELVVGSTTAYTIAHAPCPVLLTR